MHQRLINDQVAAILLSDKTPCYTEKQKYHEIGTSCNFANDIDIKQSFSSPFISSFNFTDHIPY